MGAAGFDFDSADEVMEEIASLTPSYGGITHDRIEQVGLQWPCPDASHPGTRYLHAETFPRPNGRGRFFPLQYRPPDEEPDAEYPLVLTTERSLYHYHTSTMTRRVPGLETLRPEELVEIHPRDAVALAIASGDRVRVTSRRGEVEAHALVTEVSPPGTISMTFHFPRGADQRAHQRGLRSGGEDPRDQGLRRARGAGLAGFLFLQALHRRTVGGPHRSSFLQRLE